MRVTRKSRLQTRARNVFFIVLLIAVVGLLGWLSTVYVGRADWTHGHRNTLSQPSLQLLTTLTGPVQITAFATRNKRLRRTIRGLVGKYHRANSAIRLKFVDPNTAPDEVRSLGISVNGEMVVHYQHRTQKVTQFTESALTNALARVARSAERRIVFITGHGEMSPKGDGKLGLQRFAHALKQQGFKVGTLNLTDTPKIPQNTAAVVIAGPQSDFLSGEVAIIRRYIRHGGNLLWLHDPGSEHGLGSLAGQLHVSLPHGAIVDATSPMFGVRDVRSLVLTHYGNSPITRGLNAETLYPGATAVEVNQKTGAWHDVPFVKSRGLPRSWLETGKLQGQVAYNPQQGDKAGPLNVGVEMTRPQPAAHSKSSATHGGTKTASEAAASSDDPAGPSKPHSGQQRVVVMGSAYFLANAYVDSGGNQTLGLNLVNWLSHDDRFINIHPVKAPGLTLRLGAGIQQLIVYGFLIALPLLLLLMGAGIWARRRRA